MGDLDLASSYHHRYTNAVFEPIDSPQRGLSSQRIKKLIENYSIYK